MNREGIAIYVIGALIFITFETFMHLFYLKQKGPKGL